MTDASVQNAQCIGKFHSEKLQQTSAEQHNIRQPFVALLES